MNTSHPRQCDVAIIGGGPVGSALALALRESGLNIVILEARQQSGANQDPRALALAYGTRLLLDKLGVWQDIAPVSPIKTIRISQKNTAGKTRLHAAEMKVPELGYVLPYSVLQNALEAGGCALTGFQCLRGANVDSLTASPSGAQILFQHEGAEHCLEAHLAVVADGGKLLEATHPPALSEYGQSALIAHVTCAHPQTDTAFEFFTPQGPLALLPYRDGYEIVWTGEPAQISEMLTWDDATFLSRLQQHFGNDLGAFLSVGARSHYPLRLKRAPDTTLPHIALIGNAAQTLHPVAGQGFNMGIRDAWELARLILRTPTSRLGSATMLADYRQRRRLDREGGIRFTDSLVRIFSNDEQALKHGRSLALALLNCVPPAKKWIARRMMFGANG